MRERYDTLVEHAAMVSNELIRASILLPELWHEALEEASRLYFRAKNSRAMLQALRPVHALMARGPETAREAQFHAQYGAELQDALGWCAKWEAGGGDKCLEIAWDGYYKVHLSRAQPRATLLHPNSRHRLTCAHRARARARGVRTALAPSRCCSGSTGSSADSQRSSSRTSRPTCTRRATWRWPCPVRAARSARAHPRPSHPRAAAAVARCAHARPRALRARSRAGTYRAGQPVVRIRSFRPTLVVIASKQRPRRLEIVGDDGRCYSFLLKGHEVRVRAAARPPGEGAWAGRHRRARPRSGRAARRAPATRAALAAAPRGPPATTLTPPRLRRLPRPRPTLVATPAPAAPRRRRPPHRTSVRARPCFNSRYA